MNKERLEWVMSGLNQYTLTKTEDHFVKTAVEDFGRTNAMTEPQEEKLETLYKEKSKLTPNKRADRFSCKESSPEKAKPRKPRWRAVV